MKVFVTGATGFVGSVVVAALLEGGHEVAGLARSEASAGKLVAQGVKPVRGELGDLELLQRSAREADGTIHTAFNHDFSKFAENAAEDVAAITAIGESLKGTTKPLLTTSGVAYVKQGGMADERDRANEQAHPSPRRSEAATMALREIGVNAGLVRLPPSTHGAGDGGFVPMLITLAHQKGKAGYIAGLANSWSAAHRTDAAQVYVRAITSGQLEPVYHAVAEGDVPFREIAETIGEGLGVPVMALSDDDVAEYFGWFEMFARMDQKASSELTQSWLNWVPVGPGLIEDMKSAGYFDLR